MAELTVERVKDPGKKFFLRNRRLAIGAGVLLALYAAAGFWLVPHLMRSAITDYVENDLQRKVAIGVITFNPFTLDSTIENFALREADNTPLLSFGRLHVNFQISSIIYRAWIFKEVLLDAPDLRLLIDADGQVNLSKLRSSETEPPASEQPSVAIPAVRIGTLSVSQGRIGFEDRSGHRQTPFTATLEPIRFTLTDFRTARDYQNGYSFEGSTLAGERLAWSGQFSVDPLGSTGQFTVAALQARTVAAYFDDALKFDLRSGVLDLEGRYRVALPDSLQLNIDLPTLRLSELALSPKSTDDAEPWIFVRGADITNTAFSYHERSLGVEAIRIDEAKARIWRGEDGNLNVQNLFGVSEPAPETVSPDPHLLAATNPEWALRVGAVTLSNAALDVEDRMVRPPARWNIAPANATLTNYSNQPGTATAADVNLTIDGSGRMAAKGEVILTPLSSKLALDISDFPLVPLQPYLAEAANLEMTDGRASVKGDLSVQTVDDASQIAFAGDAAISSLATRDSSSRQNLVSWDELRLAGVRYSDKPAGLDIERIVARRPYSRVVISEEGALNIRTALRAGNSAPVSTAAPTAQPMPVRIRAVAIENGTADFSDYSVEPNFSAAIVDLKGGVSGLTSDSRSRAELKLTGNVDRYAPVEISGQVNLLSAAVYSDVQMNFRNMELTTFNPYSGKYAGYSISKGKLTTELHYKIDNRKLDAKHHVVLDQLEFGDATESKSKVPLPIRLAAALLKDRHGIIDLNVPVSGSLDDPDFSVGPIIWKAFVGLLTKAVTAPFNLLGSLFGGGDEIAFVDFAPGNAALAPDQLQKIATLAKALVERPGLRLDIPLQTVIAEDDEILTRSALEAALTPLLGISDPAVPPTREQRLAALAQLHERTLGAAPVYPTPAAALADPTASNIEFLEKTLRTRFQPTADQRAALARARAVAVQTAILGDTSVAPERVFLAERESGKTAVPGTVRMEFELD